MYYWLNVQAPRSQGSWAWFHSSHNYEKPSTWAAVRVLWDIAQAQNTCLPLHYEVVAATPREQWIAALRSGEFEQGQRRLERTPGGALCCLGVACVVAERNGVPVLRHDGRVAGVDLHSQPLVAAWLGLHAASDTTVSLITMNDADGNTFAQIADYIEAQGEPT